MNLRRNLLLALIFVFFSNLITHGLFAEVPDFDNVIKLHVWAELDAYPELKEAQDVSSGQWDYPVSRIKELAPFFINGMVYGWNFSYTPSDKMRNVKEVLEVTDIKELTDSDNKIVYEKPWIQDNALHCWVVYERTEGQKWIFQKWNSINIQKIQGKGEGHVSLGFDGIKLAAQEALKKAVREHYRPLIKNKPKEITGKVIIRKEPKIGIVQGRYMVELDFFLETDRIIPYSVF